MVEGKRSFFVASLLFFCLRFFALTFYLFNALDRGVYQDVEAPVSEREREERRNEKRRKTFSMCDSALSFFFVGVGVNLASSHLIFSSDLPANLPQKNSWFILKQGKIFWFKTDQVTPVSVDGGGFV